MDLRKCVKNLLLIPKNQIAVRIRTRASSRLFDKALNSFCTNSKISTCISDVKLQKDLLELQKKYPDRFSNLKPKPSISKYKSSIKSINAEQLCDLEMKCTQKIVNIFVSHVYGFRNKPTRVNPNSLKSGKILNHSIVQINTNKAGVQNKKESSSTSSKVKTMPSDNREQQSLEEHLVQINKYDVEANNLGPTELLRDIDDVLPDNSGTLLEMPEINIQENVDDDQSSTAEYGQVRVISMMNKNLNDIHDEDGLEFLEYARNITRRDLGTYTPVITENDSGQVLGGEFKKYSPLEKVADAIMKSRKKRKTKFKS